MVAVGLFNPDYMIVDYTAILGLEEVSSFEARKR